MSNYYRKVGEVEHDNLVTGLSPQVEVQVITLLQLAQAATYPKGTLLGVHTAGAKAGKCVILGTAAGGGENVSRRNSRRYRRWRGGRERPRLQRRLLCPRACDGSGRVHPDRCRY